MGEVGLSRAEFTLLRDYIDQNCGIALGDQKTYLVAGALQGLLVKYGCRTFYELYLRAREDADGDVCASILDAVTTKETLWFRDRSPFAVLGNLILPELSKHIESGRRGPPIRIWSAGCSTGQEPYSIGMTILDYLRGRADHRVSPTHFEIVASDISAAALKIASEARYDRLTMSRGIDESHVRRYFLQKGRTWTICDEVKRMVTFRGLNLLGPFDDVGSFDVVFLRNVVVYLSDRARRDVLTRMRAALTDHGYLFLGSTESHLFSAPAYERLECDDGVCFRPARGGATS